MAQFTGDAHWAEPSLLFAHRAPSTPLKFKNKYLVFALMEETAVQAVVSSIIWASLRLKNPRSQDEMGAHSYSLHSVCPQLSFFSSSYGLGHSYNYSVTLSGHDV